LQHRDYSFREGIRVALVGRPNVGKSSLLNALLKESRAIVTAIPGTTRDLIEEVLTYRGIPIRLVDTAGIGAPTDEVEAIGVARAEQAMKEADIRIWVIDGSEALTSVDLSLAQKISATDHIVVINKADLPMVVTEEIINGILPESPVFVISAQKKEGLESLKDAIVARIAGGGNINFRP
jgi:tRNA modification GTPase